MEITLPYNWTPRKYQEKLWRYLENGGKRAVEVAHRRWGKDDVCLRWASIAVMEKPATYWHMLPEATQARKAIWTAINPHTGIRRIDEAFPEEIRANTNDQEMFIRLKNGATWQVCGSDNYNSLVGSPPYGVVFSEWPLAKQDAWAYIRPILAENGGWAFFIYTPRGENHGLAMLEIAQSEDGWFSEVSTVDDTDVFTPEQLAAEKRELIKLYGKSRGEALFNQEYYCSFYEAFTGKVVYPDFNRKTHVAEEPLLPIVQSGVKAGGQIIRGWDNTGLHPAAIITYINSIGQWYLVKEFWGDDIDIVTFTESVLLWCNQTFPGCINYRDVADPAGKNRDSIKKSAAQYVLEECNLHLEDGIQTFSVRKGAVTQRLNKLVQGEPAIVIDPVGCPLAVKGFEGGYCYPEIGQSGHYKKEPEKKSGVPYADIHDAIQYPATLLFGVIGEEEQEYYDRREGRGTGGY